MTYTPGAFEDFAQDKQRTRCRESYRRANKLFEKELFAEALNFIEKAIELAPDPETESSCLCLKGQILLDSNVPEAVITLRRAVSVEPEMELPHLLLAKALGKTGNWTDALAESEKAYRLSPPEAGKRNRGRREEPFELQSFILECLSIYLDKLSESEIEKQINELSDSLRRRPADQTIKVRLVHAHRALGKQLEARKAWGKALAEYDKSHRLALLALADESIHQQIGGEFLQEWIERANDFTLSCLRIYANLNDIELGVQIKALSDSLRRSPADQTVQIKLFHAHRALIIQLVDREAYAEAVEQGQRFLMAAPSLGEPAEAVANFQLGKAYRSHGSTENACIAYRHAIDLCGFTLGKLQASVELAGLLLFLKQKSECENVIRKAIQVYEDDPEIKPPKAGSAMHRSVCDAMSALYWYWTELRFEEKDYDSALAYINKAATLDPGEKKYEAFRILVLFALQRSDDALDELQKLSRDQLQLIATHWAEWGLWPDAKPDVVATFFDLITRERDKDAVLKVFAQFSEDKQTQIIDFFRKRGMKV